MSLDLSAWELATLRVIVETSLISIDELPEEVRELPDMVLFKDTQKIILDKIQLSLAREEGGNSHGVSPKPSWTRR